MNLTDKMELLSRAKNKKENLEELLNTEIINMSVNRIFFTDGEVLPTVYLIVKDSPSNITLDVEKQLMSVVDGVVFDVVNEDYYKQHISNTSQMF